MNILCNGLFMELSELSWTALRLLAVQQDLLSPPEEVQTRVYYSWMLIRYEGLCSVIGGVLSFCTLLIKSAWPARHCQTSGFLLRGHLCLIFTVRLLVGKPQRSGVHIYFQSFNITVRYFLFNSKGMSCNLVYDNGS